MLSSCLHTRSRENHKGYLGGHFGEVRHPNNAPLPIPIPLGEIAKDNLDCRLPDEDVIILTKAWPCNSPMHPPFIVLSDGNTWAICNLLNGLNVSSDLRKSSTVVEDSLKRQIEHKNTTNSTPVPP